MSRHSVAGGDIGGLFTCFAGLRDKAQARMGKLYPLVVIQEVGLDGFWIDRVLNRGNWIESHVVDAASIAVPRRRRRAKTDRIDGETLVRTLMAWKRGEPRACSMVRVPTPEDEDRRRISRERKTLIAERIEHSNRIKGLLFRQRSPQANQGLTGHKSERVQLGQRAAIYCRVSTADQSCERQERELAAFAERAGYEIAGIYKETGSGAKLDRAERKKVMALAQSRQIGAILVTELSRWDARPLISSTHCASWKAGMNGMTFDLSTQHGRLLATFLSGIAEFARDLISERVKSGLAAAKARGKKLGRHPGQRPKSDRLTPKVLALIDEGRSYRWIARDLAISKNTVADIAKRNRRTTDEIDKRWAPYRGILLVRGRPRGEAGASAASAAGRPIQALPD